MLCKHLFSFCHLYLHAPPNVYVFIGFEVCSAGTYVTVCIDRDIDHCQSPNFGFGFGECSCWVLFTPLNIFLSFFWKCTLLCCIGLRYQNKTTTTKQPMLGATTLFGTDLVAQSDSNVCIIHHKQALGC